MRTRFTDHMTRRSTLLRIAVVTVLLSAALTPAFAQIENASSFVLNRGKLWQTYGYGKSGPSFSNWTTRGVGLDWPGFDATLINQNIGGAPSYLATGGMYVGAKWHRDSILSVEDWSMYAGSIAEGGAAKYTVTTNKEVYPNGGNFWLHSNGNAGEHMLRTVWEYNKNYSDSFQIKRMLPVRVTRTVHQWSGSKTDENYIIVEYVIKNISAEIKASVPPARFVADTLHDFIAMLNYGMHANSRSWSVLFPSLSAGARNTWFSYNTTRRLIFGRATDYAETIVQKEDMGFAPSMGPIVNGDPSGEYLAPAFVGYQLLYSSRDNSGQTSKVTQTGWSAGSNSIDLSGPFNNIGSLEAQYAALKDIRLTANYISSTFDTVYMKKSRMWSLMSVGPYTIAPGDSVRIVVAEMVDGVDYDRAIQPSLYSASVITGSSQTIFLNTSSRAQFTFNNNFAHPNPPAAPKFTVDFNRSSRSVANVLTWNRDAELIPDPYTGTNTMTHYIVYRSSYLPIGPWTAIDSIAKGDAAFLGGNTYTFVDSTVDIGQSYYYALTTLSAPKASWVGSFQTVNNVPPMESSIFANRTLRPFVATIPPKSTVNDVLVVPNPFVIGEGRSQPGASDALQFVNIPNPCTIRIYTVRGDLVKTITVNEGTGAIVTWDQVTDYGQYVESGVYIYHVESPFGKKIGKFAIVR